MLNSLVQSCFRNAEVDMLIVTHHVLIMAYIVLVVTDSREMGSGSIDRAIITKHYGLRRIVPQLHDPRTYLSLKYINMTKQ